MPRPRKSLVSRSDTPYYHCVSRCVRRAFLCGSDSDTGHCYEHRRQWIVERLHLLASVFAIDICAYAVMSNHYHLVIKLGSAEDWSDEEVVAHWLSIFQGPLLARRFRDDIGLNIAQRQTITDTARVWRQRLQDLSWFMKCLNEPIARQANEEDACTGHFWEARFKSQALRTEQALLTCMAYVDLNPIRANMAATPETSDYTSLQERLSPSVNPKIQQQIRKNYPERSGLLAAKPLLHFCNTFEKGIEGGIPFSFDAYLMLVDWTGRIVRSEKPGAIPSNHPAILERLAIKPDQWLINSHQFEQIYYRRFGGSLG